MPLVAALVTVLFATLLSSSAFAETKHSFLTADSSKQIIAIIDEQGETQWKQQIGPLHDLHVLANGNILFQRNWTTVVEVDPKTNETVWQYEATPKKGRRIEIHAFQRLPNGNTMVTESGTSRILEIDANGKIVHKIPLQVSKPQPHRDTRLVRALENGNYLVCHEGDAVVREYQKDGTIVWDYPVPLFGKEPRNGHGVEGYGNQCFAACRLANGNTLISTGNGHRVIEVNHDKEIVWSLDQNELPNIQLAWVTTLQVLPNGNIVIGNCHAGPENPQVIEITRDKEVVWTFHDFERFGNATTNTQILTTNGKPIKAEDVLR